MRFLQCWLNSKSLISTQYQKIMMPLSNWLKEQQQEKKTNNTMVYLNQLFSMSRVYLILVYEQFLNVLNSLWYILALANWASKFTVKANFLRCQHILKIPYTFKLYLFLQIQDICWWLRLFELTSYYKLEINDKTQVDRIWALNLV